MRLLILGATGAIGHAAASAAVAAGHEVTAYVRSPDKLGDLASSVAVVRGDALDADAVAAAVPGHDAVVNALGSSPRREELDTPATAMRYLTAAMERHGVSRLVGLAGAATAVPGERKPARGRIASAVVRLFARSVVEAKQREFEVVAASATEWTMVRPPRVAPGAPSGLVELADELRGFRVTSGDVGTLMVELASGHEWVRRAPYVSRRRDL